MSDSLKKMSNSLIFGERPERFTHITQREWANHSGFLNLQKNLQKRTEKYIFVNFFWVNCLFFVSERGMSNSLKKRASCSFALLSWATWANRSQPLMSDLSDLLTITHLSRAIWANCSQLLICPEQFERMSKWAMSEFPTLKFCTKLARIRAIYSCHWHCATFFSSHQWRRGAKKNGASARRCCYGDLRKIFLTFKRFLTAKE